MKALAEELKTALDEVRYVYTDHQTKKASRKLEGYLKRIAKKGKMDIEAEFYLDKGRDPKNTIMELTFVAVQSGPGEPPAGWRGKPKGKMRDLLEFENTAHLKLTKWDRGKATFTASEDFDYTGIDGKKVTLDAADGDLDALVRATIGAVKKLELDDFFEQSLDGAVDAAEYAKGPEHYFGTSKMR